MKKYLLIICILLSLIWGSPVQADYLYTHIKLGWVIYTTVSDMTWFGQHANILMGDQAYGDFTDALTANPDLILTTYVSGNSVYKYGFTNSYDAVRTYADANSLDPETIFQHYDDDKTWSSGTRSTTVLVTGYTAGLIPGYDSGTGVQTSNSRVISGSWGAAVNASKNISAISRTSNVVTVQTSTNHGLEKGDRIAIAGVTDSTNFPNGNYHIATRVDADEFTIAWSGSNASSSGGTTTYNAWSNYNINYTAPLTLAYYQYLVDVSRLGADLYGNKFNGYFYDSILNHYGNMSVLELEKTIDYKNASPPPANVTEWLFDTIEDWLVAIKGTWTTFLEGTGKTAYTAVNVDNLSYLTSDRMPFYQENGADILLLEYGISTTANGATNIDTYSKNAWSLQETYGKKIVWQCNNNATTVVGHKTWTLYSGSIWYANFPNQTTELYGPGGILSAHKTSLGAMTGANCHYWDASAKRLYVWCDDSGDPNTKAMGYYGLDESRFMTLGWFYCFSGTNAYYFPWNAGGASYSLQPNAAYNWFEGVGYNIGTPTTGGQKRDNSGNWSTATDLWSESCSTSSKAFEMWRGNGVETDDLDYALSIYHRLYARKFTNGYVVFRLRSDYLASEYAGSRPKTFTAPFAFRKLNGDGSMNPPTSSFTLAQGEGIILVTNIGSEHNFYGITSAGATFR